MDWKTIVPIIVAFVSGWASVIATRKSSAAADQRDYFQRVPDLIEKINKISDERNELQVQAAHLRIQLEQAAKTIDELTAQIAALKTMVKRKDESHAK